MTEPNAGAITVGAGTLWIAPLGTTEPVPGVLLPITAPASAVAWPAAWTQLGFTTEGSEFDWTPKLDPLEVAEQLVPIRYVTSSVEIKVMFALAEITAKHVSYAFNGGTISTSSGITTFTPPKLGAEVRVMLGWDRIDGMERIVWRQCINHNGTKQTHKRPPAMNSLPAEFVLEYPTANTDPLVHYFDASLA